MGNEHLSDQAVQGLKVQSRSLALVAFSSLLYVFSFPVED